MPFVITGVPPKCIPNKWHEISPFITPVLKKYPDDYTLQQIYEDLIATKKQLWVALDPEPQCIMITEIYTDLNNKKICQTILVSGSHLLTFWDKAMTILLAWAKYEGCDVIQSWSRKGVVKRFMQDWKILDYDDRLKLYNVELTL